MIESLAHEARSRRAIFMRSLIRGARRDQSTVNRTLTRVEALMSVAAQHFRLTTDSDGGKCTELYSVHVRRGDCVSLPFLFVALLQAQQ